MKIHDMFLKDRPAIYLTSGWHPLSSNGYKECQLKSPMTSAGARMKFIQTLEHCYVSIQCSLKLSKFQTLQHVHYCVRAGRLRRDGNKPWSARSLP